jgi:hypothetical protein
MKNKNYFKKMTSLALMTCSAILICVMMSMNANAAARSWTGIGVGAGSGTDFNNPSFWTGAGALLTTDDLTIPWNANAAAAITMSASVTVNSLTITDTYTPSAARTHSLTTNAFTLTLNGAMSVTNSCGTGGFNAFTQINISASGGLIIGTTLTANVANVSTNNNFIVFNNSGTMTVTGATSAQVNNTSTAGQVQFLVGNSPAVTTFVGNYASSAVAGTAIFLAGTIAGTATGTMVFKGNANFGARTQNTTAQIIGTTLFDGATASTQTVTCAATAIMTAFGNVVVGGTVSGNSPTVTLAGASNPGLTSLATSADLTVNNAALLNLGTFTMNRSAAGGTLRLNNTAGLAVSAASGGQAGSNFPLNFATMTLASTSTVYYFGGSAVNQTVFGGATITYGNLNLQNGTLSGTTVKTPDNNLTVAGTLGINDAFTTFAGSTFTINVAGDWFNFGVFTGNTSTVNFNGSANALIYGSSTTPFKTVTINKGTSTATILSVTGTATVATALSINTGLLRIQAGGSFTHNGSNIPVLLTAGIQVNGGTLAINGATLNNDGSFTLITGTATVGSASGNALDNSATATVDIQGGILNVAGRLRLNAATMTVSGGTITLCTVGLNNANRAVLEMGGTSNFTMTSGTPVIIFQNANAGAGGDLVITSGGGSKTASAGTFQYGNSTTTASTLFQAECGITVNNVTLFSGKTLTVNIATSDLTVSNALTLNDGIITTAGTLAAIINPSATISRTTGYVNGRLRKKFNTGSGQSFQFEIGSATYAPVLVNNIDVTSSGNVTALTASGLNPSENLPSTNSSGINQSARANRYWILTAAGGYAMSTSNATFNFSAGEATGTPTTYVVRKYDPSAWATTTVGTQGATSTQATGITSFSTATGFSEFEVGTPNTITVGTNPSSTSACAGGNATFTTTAPVNSPVTTIKWQENTGGGFLDITNGGIYSGSGSTTLTLTGVNTGMNGYLYRATFRNINNTNPGAPTASATLTVSAQPTASAGGSQTICQTGTATVSGASSSNGAILWTHNGNGTISNATTLTPTYNAVAADGGTTVTLTMTVSNAPCTPATAIYTVIVRALPTASAGGNATICENSTYTLTAGEANSSNGSRLWTENGAGSITAGATTLTPTYTAAAGDVGNAVTLTLTVTSNNACAPATATATYTVNVQGLPTATAGGSATICENSAYTLTAGEANSTHGTILWTENGAGSITGGATTLTPTYTAAPGDAGNAVTLTMTVTSNNACSPGTATATYTVNVEGLPTAVSGGSTSLCLSTGSYTLQAGEATSSNGTISWAENGAGSITAGGTTLTPTYTAAAGDVGNAVTLTMTVSSTNSCAPATATAIYTINVNDIPPNSAITAISQGLGEACSGMTELVNANPGTDPNLTYGWSKGGTPSGLQFSTTGIAGSFVPGPFPTTAPQVYVEFGGVAPTYSGWSICARAINGCGPSNHQKCVFVRGAVSAPDFITGPTVVCANSSISYTTGTVTGASVYTWSFPGATYVNQGSNVVTVNFPTNTAGNLCVTASVGCAGAVQSQAKCITVSPNVPMPGVINGGPATVCPGSSYTYSVVNDPNAASYQWTLPAGLTGSSTTNSITVLAGSITGTPPICVAAVSPCTPNMSASRCKNVGTAIALMPGNIGGSSYTGVCSGSTLTYTIAPVSGVPANGYTWVVPGVATNVSANGTTSISFDINSPFVSDLLKISANNGLCPGSPNGGEGPQRTVTLIGAPATPVTITAIPNPVNNGCSGQFVASTSFGAATYTWTVPSGTTIIGVQTTNTLNVTWGTGTGVVTAKANNTCGSSGTKSFTNLATAGACRMAEGGSDAASAANFSVYPNPAHSKITIEINNDKDENAVISLSDISGRTLLSNNVELVNGRFTADLELSQLAPGAYFIAVEKNNSIMRQRIVVE